MKIGICIKQVPARDEELAVSDDGLWVRATENYDSCEPDDYALEAALNLQEAHGGEVIAVSVGGASVTEVLKTALAKGADRAIHVAIEDTHTLDPLQIATCLATAMKEEQLDLILTGLQSDDQGHGQTGVLLAALLERPHGTVVVDLSVDSDSLSVRRELEGGWFQQAALPLPAVLTIQSGTNKPRYATFKGILKAKKKEIRTLSRADVLPADQAATQTTLRVYVPQTSKQTEMIEGAPKDQAAALVDKLRNVARVL